MGKQSFENETTSKSPTERPAWQRVLIAIGPPLIAFAVEFFLLGTHQRWLLFIAAVFVSSWLGGLTSGVVATFLSTALAWWLLVPPETSLEPTDPRYYLTAAMFIAIGIAISLFHEWLRRTTRAAALALDEARRANEALKRSAKERRIFAAVIENSPDLIAMADPNGKPVYINPGGRRMIGMPADFPIGTTQIPDFYAPEVRDEAYAAVLKDMREGAAWSGETKLRNWATEKVIPVWDTHFMVEDPETGQVIGLATITRDISELKRTRDELETAVTQLRQTTRELKESQQLLQAVMDHSPAIVAVEDLEGRILLYNRKLEQTLGLTNGELKGRTAYDLFPSDIANSRRKADEAVIDSGQPLTIEEEMDLKDGTHVFLANVFPLRDERRNTLGVCWIETDITARKRAEESLRQTAADLNEAQHVAHIGSWQLGCQDGHRPVVRRAVSHPWS